MFLLFLYTKNKKIVKIRKCIVCKEVDWSGDWATPWGSASQMRPWSERVGERKLKASRPVITPS